MLVQPRRTDRRSAAERQRPAPGRDPLHWRDRLAARRRAMWSGGRAAIVVGTVLTIVPVSLAWLDLISKGIMIRISVPAFCTLVAGAASMRRAHVGNVRAAEQMRRRLDAAADPDATRSPTASAHE